MGIRKRESKKAKRGYTYQVYFSYVDYTGQRKNYFKSGFLTKKEALEHEKTKKRELLKKASMSIDMNITVHEVWNEYMDTVGQYYYKPSTQAYYRFSYKKYVENKFGHKKIYSIKYDELQVYFNGFKSYQTARNVKKVLVAIFKYAIKERYIKQNPMTLVNLNTQTLTEKKEQPTITKEQLEMIIEEMIKPPSINAPHKKDSQFYRYSYAVALYIGYYMGLRVSEVFGLSRDDIDFDKNLIYVHQRIEYHQKRVKDIYLTDQLKTSSSTAYLPMPKALREVLLKWLNYHDFQAVICNSKGEYMSPQNLYPVLRKITKQLNIDFRFHTLRHTYTTNLINKKINPSIVKQLVRHNSINTTLDVYTHISDNKIEAALNQTYEGDNNANKSN